MKKQSKKSITKLGLFLVALGLGVLGAKLTAPVPPPPLRKDLMVHDYVFRWAQLICEKHNTSFHYIVPVPTLITVDKHGQVLCDDLYKIRCQDESIYELNTGASYCDGVGKSQWDETMKMDGPLTDLRSDND